MAVITLNRMFEIRAGKMRIQGNMVHADPRPGLLYVYQDDGGLMHFCWKDVNADKVEDDIVLNPDLHEYCPVPECTTGHAYLLLNMKSKQMNYYWIQEANQLKEIEHFNKLRDYLTFFKTKNT